MPAGTSNDVIKGCGCHHIALQTRDWDAALKLYQDVLGMKVAAKFGSPDRKVWLLDMGDGSFMELFEPTEGTPAPGAEAPNDPIFHFALATSDTQASTERVRQAGYEITVEPKTVELGDMTVTLSFFKGPCGEVVEFFQVH